MIDMLMGVYAVFDNKAQAFQMPHFAQTDGLAIRTFGDACRTPETSLAMHPADFQLVRIGTYDDQVGELTRENHKALCMAADFVDHRPVGFFDDRKDGEDNA